MSINELLANTNLEPTYFVTELMRILETTKNPNTHYNFEGNIFTIQNAPQAPIITSFNFKKVKVPLRISKQYHSSSIQPAPPLSASSPRIQSRQTSTKSCN